MRKGALTTGIMTCNSRPVDIRGWYLVPEIALSSGENGIVLPPAQVKVEVRNGHPKTVVCRVVTCGPAMRSCDCCEMKSIPVSTNAAMVTGPTMGMRYSRL